MEPVGWDKTRDRVSGTQPGIYMLSMWALLLPLWVTTATAMPAGAGVGSSGVVVLEFSAGYLALPDKGLAFPPPSPSFTQIENVSYTTVIVVLDPLWHRSSPSRSLLSCTHLSSFTAPAPPVWQNWNFEGGGEHSIQHCLVIFQFCLAD